MSKQDAILAKLAQLKQQYIEGLPSKFAELSTLTNQLRNNPADFETLNELYANIHKMAGSAGSCGLTELSQRAMELQTVLREWKKQQSPVKETELQQFVLDLEDLKQAVNTDKKSNQTIDIGKNTSPAHTEDQGVRLWIVDSDQNFGDTVRQQLESFGFDVALFNQLETVQQGLNKETPHLILLDTEVEDVEKSNQVNMLQKLVELGIPLVIVSERDDFQARVRSVQIGAEGYVLKPLDIPKLVRLVNDIVKKRRSKPPKVLVVDDDLFAAKHYQLILQSDGMEVEILDEPENLIEKVAVFQPELVLMDLYMPKHTGLELAGVLRQFDHWTSLPIVYLSAETDIDRKNQAIATGADDFLTKPIAAEQLITMVNARVARSRELDAQISFDGLTGLLKHSSIKQAVVNEVARADRHQRSLAVVMLDIDNFKRVNDQYGHAMGDVVISTVAVVLNQRLRKSDIAGRYGGEEFLAILPECDLDAAYRLLNDIRQRFAAIDFRFQDTVFNCTISVGIAAHKQKVVEASELINQADTALYQAKKSGRNQVVKYTDDKDS